MHLLLIHQNFPGQFRDLAPAWLRAGHRVTAIGSDLAPTDADTWEGLEHFRYSWPEEDAPSPSQRGEAVAQVCRQLQTDGCQPDVVMAHSGWGETLQLRKVWPSTPIVVLPELWGSPQALGFGFDADLPPEIPDPAVFEESNRITEQALLESDIALVPCRSQWRSFPLPLRAHLHVLPEGLDMECYSQSPQIPLKCGDLSIAPDKPVVTLVSRHLEPLRGLRQICRAWPIVHEQRPDAALYLVGMVDSGGYGIEAPSGASHLVDGLASLDDEVKGSIHALGVLPHHQMVTLLQRSSCHVAMSYPYTLSWSNLEALACGAPVVTNLGSPLSQELIDGESGLFCDFNDVRGLAEAILECINDPDLGRWLGKAGQAVAVERFSQSVALDAHERLFEELGRKGPAYRPARPQNISGL